MDKTEDTIISNNTIECISRKYRVKTSEGMIIDVESTKPMNDSVVRQLLEEDNEIGSFFSNYKIVNIDREVLSQSNVVGPKADNENAYIPPIGKFSPIQRFNILLRMKGEFSSKDYMKHLLEMYKVKIARYVAFDDISMAQKAERVEMIRKSGRFNIYKVIDSSNVDEDSYASILKKSKVPINAIQ